MQRDGPDAGLQDPVCEPDRLCGCGRLEWVLRQFVAMRDALLCCVIPADARWPSDGPGPSAATFGLWRRPHSVDMHRAY